MVSEGRARGKLAPSDFALPPDRYPIDTIERARNALARVAQFGTPDERARVRAAVHARYPSIKIMHEAAG